MPYKDPEKRKQYHKEYHSKWYQQNKERHRENVVRNKRRYREDWRAYKASLSCQRCGIQHPAVIDFHHVDPKGSDTKVNSLVAAGRFSAAIKEAEERCIPLCANCHRIHHWELFNTIE